MGIPWLWRRGLRQSGQSLWNHDSRVAAIYQCVSGDGCGVVFKLTPSGSGWSESGLYSFENGSDGAYPEGGVTFDASGNLYGATTSGGSDGGGTVFELSPFSGYWNFTLLASLVSNQQAPGVGARLLWTKREISTARRRAGGLYDEGTVFKLTPSNGGWIFTSSQLLLRYGWLWPVWQRRVRCQRQYLRHHGPGRPLYAGTVWEITP